MILITGASGFIGSSLLDAYGNEAIGLQRSLDSSSARLFPCDLTNVESVSKIIATLKDFQITHVIHTAAITPWSKNPDYALDIVMAESVSRICYELNIPQLIFISGWNVYDMSGRAPFSEETAIRPADMYAQSKVNIEQYFNKNLKNTEYVSLRTASIYGLGQTSPGLITNLVDSALRTQTMTLKSLNTRRDYLYIDDLVDTVILLTQNREKFRGGALNIGSGSSTSVLEIAQDIQVIFHEKYGLEVSIKFDEALRDSFPIDNKLDITKARSYGLLRKPIVLKEGLTRYIDWKRQ